MRFLYAVEDAAQLRAYASAAQRLRPRLDAYIAHIENRYAVRTLPRVIVLTGMEAATQLLSGIPVPACTNEYRVMFCPDPEVWQNIWLSQLEGLSGPEAEEIRAYYQTVPNDNCLLSILGHELAHHSELFFDDFDDARDGGIWFEEGMVEYIGREYFLTPIEFAEEARINRLLVHLLEKQYGSHSLENFGAATYDSSYAAIFFEYWRSFLAVRSLVEQLGSIEAVFQSYRRWGEQDSVKTLSEWFQIT